MRHSLVTAFVAIAALMAPPAHAEVTGGARNVQEVFFNYSEPILDANGTQIGFAFADFIFRSERGVDVSGPVDVASGGGFVERMIFGDPQGHTFQSFPMQDVDPTALVVDPAGNSVTIDTLLYTDPDDQTDGYEFDLSMTKPASIFVNHPDTHNPGVNAYTTTDGSAEASANLFIGLRRTGYTISGIIAGEAVTADPTGCGGTCGWAFTNVGHGVRLDPVATTP